MKPKCTKCGNKLLMQLYLNANQAIKYDLPTKTPYLMCSNCGKLHEIVIKVTQVKKIMVVEK